MRGEWSIVLSLLLSSYCYDVHSFAFTSGNRFSKSVRTNQLQNEEAVKPERLQKFLSQAGVCSRRNAEVIIQDGRVRVNGELVIDMGRKVHPLRDIVLVDNMRVGKPDKTELMWIVMYKPKGVVCTTKDENGRKTVTELIPLAETSRILPIGRLDRDTSGLIILTNENEWINRMTHPSFGHMKRYRVSVLGDIPQRAIDEIEGGLYLPDLDTKLAPAKTEVLDFDRAAGETRLELVLREGKNRQIRRMMEAVGLNAVSIKRIGFGPITLGSLKPGEYRQLRPYEVDKLKRSLGTVATRVNTGGGGMSRNLAKKTGKEGKLARQRFMDAKYQTHVEDALEYAKAEVERTPARGFGGGGGEGSSSSGSSFSDSGSSFTDSGGGGRSQAPFVRASREGFAKKRVATTATDTSSSSSSTRSTSSSTSRSSSRYEEVDQTMWYEKIPTIPTEKTATTSGATAATATGKKGMKPTTNEEDSAAAMFTTKRSRSKHLKTYFPSQKGKGRGKGK